MTDENKKIIEKLPDKFTRKDFLKKYLGEGKSFSTAGTILTEAVAMGMLVRKDRGIYVKR